MSNILKAKIEIVGVRPLLWHVFTPAALDKSGKERTGSAGNDPEEWRGTFTATKDGQLYMEQAYAFSTIVAGAKSVPKGRGSIQSYVQSTLVIEGNRILVDRWFPGYPNGVEFDPKKVDPPPTDDTLPVYLDIRGVVNPATKGRNVRYRIASSTGWHCGFGIAWDKTVVNRAQMEAALIAAGQLVGIGNGRKIGMGRFEVEKFEVIE